MPNTVKDDHFSHALHFNHMGVVSHGNAQQSLTETFKITNADIAAELSAFCKAHNIPESAMNKEIARLGAGFKAKVSAGFGAENGYFFKTIIYRTLIDGGWYKNETVMGGQKVDRWRDGIPCKTPDDAEKCGIAIIDDAVKGLIINRFHSGAVLDADFQSNITPNHGVQFYPGVFKIVQNENERVSYIQNGIPYTMVWRAQEVTKNQQRAAELAAAQRNLLVHEHFSKIKI